MRRNFRKFTRLAGVLAVTVPFATCADLTGPSGRGVQVPFAPSFSPAATFARALYAAAGIEYDRVRVVIARGATVLKDTTVDFNPASTELPLSLTIAATPGEVLTATLEYRSASIILYSGTSPVTTIALGAAAPASPTPIVLVPVGPGSTADTVKVTPPSGLMPITAAVQLSASAVTSTGTAITNPIFGWTVEDATVATVNAQGLVQPTTKGGLARVRATTLNGKFAESSITFFTTPASLAIQSGNNQSAMAFEPLPANVVVKVLDVNSNGVPGATVAFAVATGGGTVNVINGISDASGLVSAKWVLGEAVGPQTLSVTAAALPSTPLTLNATATERPAVALAFQQQPSATTMGASISPAVTVRAIDDKGRTVGGYTGAITIALDNNPSSGTLGGTLTANAVAGVASFTNLTVSAAGAGYTLKASATGLPTNTSAPFHVEQVPAGLSLNAGGNQTAVIRATLPQMVVVKVADANGVGAPGVTVAFEVVSGGGSIVVNNAVTDVNGLARVTWTLGDVVGEQSIRATTVGLTGSPLTINATATPLPAIALAFVQGPSNVTMSATMAPAVTVKAIDADGKIVTGFTGNIALTLENNPNSATLGGTTTQAAVNGVATFGNLSVNMAGSGFKLKAVSGSLTFALSGEFVVSPPPAVGLQFQQQPTNVVKSALFSPVIQVKVVDANGNTVPGSTSAITIGLDNPLLDVSFTGTKTVNAVNGVATFNDLKVNTEFNGLKLKATTTTTTEPALTPVTSNAFNVTLPPSAARTWVGTTSVRWNNPNNWSPAGLPIGSDTVIISGGAANQPVIDSAATAKYVIIEAGNSLRVNNNAILTIAIQKILNKGKLHFTSGFIGGDIENRDTLLVDGSVIAHSVLSTSTGVTKVISTGLDSVVALQLTGSFINEGQVTLTDANESGAMLGATDSIVNRAGATITAAEGAAGSRTLYGVLRNYGTIAVPSSAGLTLFHPAGGSVNAGSITFTGGGNLEQRSTDSTFLFTNTGTINLGGGSWDFLSGKLRVLAGSVLNVLAFRTQVSQLDIDFSLFQAEFGIDEWSRFSGDSLVVPSGKTMTIRGSTIAQPVSVRGTLIIKYAAASSNLVGGLRVTSTGEVDARGNVWLDGTLDFALGGKVRVTGEVGNVEFTASNSFTNRGTIDLTSTCAECHAVLHVGAGTITNEASGNINVLTGAGGGRRIQGVLDNRGLITVDAGSHVKLTTGAAAHTNTGKISLSDAAGGATATDANTGSFTIEAYESASTLTNTGEIYIGANRAFYIESTNSLVNGTAGKVDGKGTVRVPTGATFTNYGTIRPGGELTAGKLTVDGNWTAGTGKLELDLGGTAAGTFDVLQVTGMATLQGANVKLNYIGGFNPAGATLLVVPASSFDTSEPAVNFDPPEWSHYIADGFHIQYTGPPSRKGRVPTFVPPPVVRPPLN